MQRMPFGNTGLEVSRLTFGCGAVGGLMTKGEAADQDRAVAWARDNGVNFFDTAASYGDGVSERNLGRALAGNSDGLVVSTKVGVSAAGLADVERAVSESLEASLERLGLERVDIFQLHNTLETPSDLVHPAPVPPPAELLSATSAYDGFHSMGIDLAPYTRLYEAFAARIQGREIPSDPVPPTFADGVAVQAVLDAIRRSSREKRWIDID